MTATVKSFAELEDEFDAFVGTTVYATMVTVDARNRPRARVLIPVWERVDGRPLGWLATYRTPVKAAHIAGNPHTTFSYWRPGNNSVAIDAVAAWVEDLEVKRHVWDLYRKTSPRGAGYDLGNFWRSPADPELHVLRLEPYRIQVIRGGDLRSRLWRVLDGDSP
ncbi:pyridoxamine 5'-phosphate oxidase family protein [Nonomuraea turkmeniaca]|uniref:Pyridoxamine 5'-phosphate oxidase family protein n=1 Tax=Nonomuraea turkmeniaca TaxID=103838 RepID=A0A5S4F942_9ACTN|nr:pyridoxamine 5'-phosphate oxidase family protein [Nonomuraea turkmeniaca]TMR13443.1 pyridoxamine 5'-phosphate oxidase family protein [Nonomuraea turkmeniaca]